MFRAGQAVLFSPSSMCEKLLRAKILDQEAVGTFHSHPVGVAVPGSSDIKYAVDDSLMFIFDCTDKKGKLWRIRNGRAQSVKFYFALLRRQHDTLK
jgi:proteasome lid subunit RPN8/RPN11